MCLHPIDIKASWQTLKQYVGHKNPLTPKGGKCVPHFHFQTGTIFDLLFVLHANASGKACSPGFAFSFRLTFCK